MSDPWLTTEHEDLRQRVRGLRDDEIIPYLRGRGFDRPLDRDEVRHVYKLTGAIGYPGTVVPAELGGVGHDHVGLGVTIEELAPVLGFLAAHVVTRQIAFLGTESQKERYLQPLLRADLIGTAAITEPETGSDAGSIRMTARRQGDVYLLNGTKDWLTLGNVADLATTLVSTDPEKGSRGLSRLIVELDHDRLETETFGTLGDRLLSFARVTFRDYPVPVANLIGGEGEGLKMTLRAIQASRVSMATHAVGLAQAAIDSAVAYARERKQFGKPIGSFQLLQGMLAEMIAETDAARLLSYRAWAMIDRGEECAREASIAKFYATEAAVRVISKAIQIHGANGVSERYPVERYFRDARMLTFPDGTSEVHKLLIGRLALGIDAFR